MQFGREAALSYITGTELFVDGGFAPVSVPAVV
jgi:hypothetical protein